MSKLLWNRILTFLKVVGFVMTHSVADKLNKLACFAFVVLFGLGLVGVASASEKLGASDYYNLASAAYNKGEFNSALDAFAKASELNDNRADYQLGVMYLYGRGVHEDEGKAFTYFTKSSEAGNDGAAFILGRLYIEGNGKEPEPLKAIKIYEDKANEGNPFFQYVLGKLYLDGKVVPKDTETALMWLEKAGEAGSAHALNELGLFYENAADEVKSQSYFMKAANMGYAPAAFKTGGWNEGEKVASLIENNATSVEDKAEKTENVWMVRLAGEGDVNALYELADVFNHMRSGLGYDWSRKGSSLGDIVALDVFSSKKSEPLQGNALLERLMIPLIFVVIIVMVLYSVRENKKLKQADCMPCFGGEDGNAYNAEEPIILLKEDVLIEEGDVADVNETEEELVEAVATSKTKSKAKTAKASSTTKGPKTTVKAKSTKAGAKAKTTVKADKAGTKTKVAKTSKAAGATAKKKSTKATKTKAVSKRKESE